MPKIYQYGEGVDEKSKRNLLRIVSFIFILLALLGGVFIFKLDINLFSATRYSFTISKLVEVLLFIQVARLLDWIVSKVMLHNYYVNRDVEQKKKQEEGRPKTTGEEVAKEPESKATRTIQYIVYIILAIIIIRAFRLEDTNVFSDYERGINLNFSNILTAILVLFVARLLVWLMTQLVLYRYYKKQAINVGSQYAINQLLKYVIYVLATLMALDQLGIQMNVIWGGAAALLVGVGLGLQQTFNDLISGIILLFERTVEVEDVVDVNGLVGKVKKIGLRTSLVETFDNITVIVPNSKLIVDNVINWSHYDDKARFHIQIGVEYGVDTALVKKLLLKVARENMYVLNYPMPIVRFVDFGDSALIFELHFWTRNFIVIEDIKSDLRFAIDHIFRENNITIPFPQRVVWSPSEAKGDGS